MGAKVAVMGWRPAPGRAAAAGWVVMPHDADRYGQALYACLRELDAGGYDLILVEQPPDTPEWQAVCDRLRRAAAT